MRASEEESIYTLRIFTHPTDLDTVAPDLSGIAVGSTTSTGSNIAWTTNEAAESVVDYGTTSAYGQSATGNSILLLNHAVSIVGLSPATTYHYRERNADGAGNENTGVDRVFTTIAGSSGTPALGAHVLLTRDETFGTSPATAPAITTRVNGSTLLAVSMGWNSNSATPSDSFNNAWTPLSPMNVYAGGNFHTIVWAVQAALGGNGHTLSMPKSAHPSGEISLGLIEVEDGGDVRMVYNNAPDWNQTPGSITVDGPATQIAVWSGDSWELSHSAVPDNGFVMVDSYLDLGPTSGVQVAIASKQVTAAGAYTVKWTSMPLQNAACYLIAIERPH